MGKAWNIVTVENFQHYWNITQIIENKAFQLINEIAQVAEYEHNSTTENNKRLINQFKINHNFSQMSAEKYVNFDISTGTTE